MRKRVYRQPKPVYKFGLAAGDRVVDTEGVLSVFNEELSCSGGLPWTGVVLQAFRSTGGMGRYLVAGDDGRLRICSAAELEKLDDPQGGAQ